MTNAEILSHIDYTLLKPDAKWDDIAALCEQAIQYKTASVCIPSCYVARVHGLWPKLNICTVIGFPLGYQPLPVKVVEAAHAVADGASEVDMVINVSALKSCEDAAVIGEIQAIKSACNGRTLKVIVEICYLNEEEKIRACEIVTAAGADYIKTSTGFGSAGANLDDIELFRRHIGDGIKMKAAGGVRTRADMEAYLAAGCERIGCSNIAVLLDE